MAFKIIWSRQATEDLQEIVTFIARDNHLMAESFGYLLMSKVDSLAQFPQLGRMLPETQNEQIREIVFRPYRIIYQIFTQKQIVAIVRVWHGARGEPEIPSLTS